jgi:hypothetical protein
MQLVAWWESVAAAGPGRAGAEMRSMRGHARRAAEKTYTAGGGGNGQALVVGGGGMRGLMDGRLIGEA